MRQPPLTLRRWNRTEYDRLVDLGMFQGEPLELIGGQLIVAEPHGSYHASSVGAVDRAVQAALPPGWIARCQLPVALDEDTEPEPDVAVVPGTHADYQRTHPARPVLVIEVADTSLYFDREPRGSVYARASVPDYWIVNVVDHVVELYRDPGPDVSAPYGFRYRSVTTVVAPSVIVPLALPSVRIAVADLLP
jgi:Uma2 family endonuclease